MLVWTRIAAEIVDELAIDDLDINVKKPDFFPTLVKMNPNQKAPLGALVETPLPSDRDNHALHSPQQGLKLQ
ncbi:hypothetical protein NPIL_442011 [Nephila pilipes]|uniref:Uncharacterized protein n=1 Tax=Nephila pilipes TaxID=299642 RepID=A0A8X6N2V1_NEPPI|nr:hypothetical protein NPIL_442011 [Nephila pilipes]